MRNRIITLTLALIADLICWSALLYFVTGCASANTPETLVSDGFYASICEAQDNCDEPFYEEAPLLGQNKNKKRKTK